MIGSNPFVGPRPFERGEKIYGREQEIRDLDHQLSAERIVLLHSPSGAGKSSMLQAGLLPRIEKRFDIRGPTRLNLEPPDDLGMEINRYALSAIRGFEEDLPEDKRRPLAEIAGQSLHEYVTGRPRRRSAPSNILLIFDQFEEVLTIDPLAGKAKREFFDQLGELLRDPAIWVLLALREDYLAPLDPYARQVPSHLRNRFRIDLLGLDGAREAMVEPARVGGREFPAADRLIEDLATMQVQQADGTFRAQAGQNVEPVQLQVVCRRLWEAMPASAAAIEDEHLAEFGDVTEALAGYYAEAMARAGDDDPLKERALRDWFDERLITEGGIRGQVLREAGSSGGLDNTLIDRLRSTHLIRAEERAGATWFELAHDRLIEPVRTDNAAWRRAHLVETQRRAALWERQDRPPGLLLADAELAEGEAWAKEAATEPTEVEERFLKASRAAQDAIERERRQTRRIRSLGFAAMIIGALALVACAAAVVQWREAVVQTRLAEEQRELAEEQRELAEEQRNEADRQRLEAERQFERAEQEKKTADEQRDVAQEQRGIAVSKEQEARQQRRIAETARDSAEVAQAEAEEARDDAEVARTDAETQRDRAEVERERADAEALESARLRLLSVASELALQSQRLPAGDPPSALLLAREAWSLHKDHGGPANDPAIFSALWQATRNLPESDTVVGIFAEDVRALALSDDGEVLVVGDADQLTRIDLRTEARSSVEGLPAAVRALDWGASGLATGLSNGAVEIRSREDLSVTVNLPGHASSIRAVAFRSGEPVLASASRDGALMLHHLKEPTESVEIIPAGGETLHALAFRDDGLLAVAGRSGLTLWDTESMPGQKAGSPDLGDWRSVAWSTDGSHLAAGKADGSIYVFEIDSGKEPVVLEGHTAAVHALAFNPGFGQLVSGGLDGSLRLWNPEDSAALPIVLRDHDAWIRDLVLTPDGEMGLSAGADRRVRHWPTRADLPAGEACALAGRRLTEEEWRLYLPADLAYAPSCDE